MATPCPAVHLPDSTPFPGAWRVDAERSYARFVARTLGGAVKIPGGFGSLAGSLVGGEEGTHGVLKIDPASVDTGNRLRDKHLRGRDFFGVAAHPQLRYELRSLTHTGNDLRLTGDALVAGMRTALPLEAKLRWCEDGAAEIVCRASVDRVALGLRGARGMVPRAVQLDVVVVLSPLVLRPAG
jgi:polyisoprenoid-binding protein YceI